jgi:hypothetical protein
MNNERALNFGIIIRILSFSDPPPPKVKQPYLRVRLYSARNWFGICMVKFCDIWKKNDFRLQMNPNLTKYVHWNL